MKKVLLSLLLTVVVMLSACGNSERTYKSGTWSTVRQDVSENRANAKEKYVGEFYSFTGEMRFIIDKDFFSVCEVNPGYHTSSISCRVKDKELQKIVLSLKEGDKVTVKGKITSIDYDVTFRTAQLEMDVYEIIK